MVAKKTGEKKGRRAALRSLSGSERQLPSFIAESIKDLSGKEKKRVKGGGGAAGGVVMSYRVPDSKL